jgi:hypothetical protein
MTYDDSGILYHTTKAYSLAFKDDMTMNELYILGVLNSSVTWFYISSISSVFRGGFYVFATDPLVYIPIPRIDFSDPGDVERHDRMVALVNSMLELNRRLHSGGLSTHEKSVIERRIAATDREIDALVYDLYNLTEDEIRIVEGE